jgi:hypothetical protein
VWWLSRTTTGRVVWAISHYFGSTAHLNKARPLLVRYTNQQPYRQRRLCEYDQSPSLVNEALVSVAMINFMLKRLGSLVFKIPSRIGMSFKFVIKA